MNTLKIVVSGLTLLILNGCCDQLPWLPWCDEPTPLPAEEIRSFTPSSFTRLCPTKIGSGDREFAGHGPDVTARASLELRNSNKEVWVILYLHVKETVGDWTEAEGSWPQHLWTAPSGWLIVSIESDQSSNASYRDTDHELDRPGVQGGSLVQRFEIMGDTGGDDVGNCTSDDVYMNVYFNMIRVKIREQ